MYERVGDKELKLALGGTQAKSDIIRVFGAFVPRANTLSISHMGGQPTSLQGTKYGFGSIIWVKMNQKNGSSLPLLLFFLLLPLLISPSLLGHQTDGLLRICVVEAKRVALLEEVYKDAVGGGAYGW